MKERLEKPIIPVPRIPDRAISRERRWGEESALPETENLLDAMTSDDDREYEKSLTRELLKLRKEGGPQILKVRDALVREKIVLDDLLASLKDTIAKKGEVMRTLKEFGVKEHFWIPAITFEYLWIQFKKSKQFFRKRGFFQKKSVVPPTWLAEDYKLNKKEETNLVEALEMLIERYRLAVDGLNGVYVAMSIEGQVENLPEEEEKEPHTKDVPKKVA